MHNTKPAQTPAHLHSRIPHTRLPLWASRPEEGLRRWWGEYSGLCWILFAEDSDKRPSTSLPLAPSASTTTTITATATAAAPSRPPLPPSTPSFSHLRRRASQEPGTWRAYLALDQLVISASHQKAPLVTAMAPLLPSLPRYQHCYIIAQLSRSRATCMWNRTRWERRCSARVEGRVGGRGLTYRGLTSSRLTRRCPSDERTSAARRIYERSSTILFREKSLLPESSEMTFSLSRVFRSNFRTIFSTYCFIKWFVPALSARPSNRSSILFRCSNVWAYSWVILINFVDYKN